MTLSDPTAAKPIVFLHGGNGSGAEMSPITSLVPEAHRAFAPNLPGHGGRPVPPQPDLDAIVADIIAQCDTAGIGRADWFGYSFGGSVAMLIAARHPERVRTVTTLATNFVLDGRSVDHMCHLVNPERLAANGRGAQLARTHAPGDWEAVARYNQALYAGFRDHPPVSRGALRELVQPSLLIGAEADPIVSAAGTRRVSQLLPNGAFAIYPGSLHPLAQAPLPAIVDLLTRFLRQPYEVVRTSRQGFHSFRRDNFPT